MSAPSPGDVEEVAFARAELVRIVLDLRNLDADLSAIVLVIPERRARLMMARRQLDRAILQMQRIVAGV